jgi:hypothetical protein
MSAALLLVERADGAFHLHVVGMMFLRMPPRKTPIVTTDGSL